MSEVVTETVKSPTGAGVEVTALEKVATGGKNICTALVIFDGSGTIIDSYNVSSVVRITTGTYDITFATAMDNTSYLVSPHYEATGTIGLSTIQTGKTVSTFRVVNGLQSVTSNQDAVTEITIFGGIA